jgi:tetratricopeptide (TPR) repeat protein
VDGRNSDRTVALSPEKYNKLNSEDVFFDQTVPHLQKFFYLLMVLALQGGALPARSQALLPYTLEPNPEQMEQAGIEMIESALQWARVQRPSAAITRAKLATQLAPDLYQSWFLLGTLYLQTDQVEPGIEALQRAISIAPEEARPGVQFSLGSAYFQKKDYQAAVTELEAALKLKPDAAPALFDLGNAYLKLGKYPESIAAYEKAVKNDQTYWPAINNIGLVKYERGDVAGALEKWRAALKIDEKQAEPELAIATALYKQGKTEEGINLAQTALTRDSRYAKLSFLEDNLWGPNLIKDTETFFSTPKMKEFLATLPPPPQVEESNEEE